MQHQGTQWTHSMQPPHADTRIGRVRRDTNSSWPRTESSLFAACTPLVQVLLPSLAFAITIRRHLPCLQAAFHVPSFFSPRSLRSISMIYRRGRWSFWGTRPRSCKTYKHFMYPHYTVIQHAMYTETLRYIGAWARNNGGAHLPFADSGCYSMGMWGTTNRTAMLAVAHVLLGFSWVSQA